MHAPNPEEHDKRLDKMLNVLQEKGITLNREKCEVSMPKLEFMGLALSECGARPSEAKVSALLNVREPMSVSEIRSCFGQVQYNARFIPDLTTYLSRCESLHIRMKFLSGDKLNKIRLIS